MNTTNSIVGTNVGFALARALGAPEVPVQDQNNDRKSDQNQNNQPVAGVRPEFRDGRYHYEGQRLGGSVPEVLGEVSLATVEKILVKFSFFEDTHFDLFPIDIEVREWLDRKKLLGDSYVDGGIQPIIVHNIGLGLVRRGLTNQGFHLADVFVCEKTERHLRLHYSRKKFAVTLEFHRGDNASVELSRKMADHLRHLASIIWQDCFVWDNTEATNTDGKKDMSVTVNCRNPLIGCKSMKSLVVRDGNIQVVEKETEEEKR
jgi:hypothetical protein